MFEIVKAIHEALGIQSTWAFVAVIAIAFGLLSGGMALIVDKAYRNSPEYRQQLAERQPDKKGDPPVQPRETEVKPSAPTKGSKQHPPTPPNVSSITPQVGMQNTELSEIKAHRISAFLLQSGTTGTVRIVFIGESQPEIVDQLFAEFQRGGWKPDILHFGTMSSAGMRADEALYVLSPDPKSKNASSALGALQGADISAPVHPEMDTIGPASLGVPDVTIVVNQK